MFTNEEDEVELLAREDALNFTCVGLQVRGRAPPLPQRHRAEREKAPPPQRFASVQSCREN